MLGVEEGVGSAHVDDLHVFDHSIRQRKCEDYLHLGGSDVSIHRNIVHRVQ